MPVTSAPPVAPSPPSPLRGRPSASISAVAWAPNTDLEYPEWAAVGRRLGAIGRCSQWWLGDWIRYGNARFGERYARAAQITHYDAQTLMNMVYVASRFEISRRRENLSWSHHAELASLDPHSQDLWLERASADRLSVADLRLALRGLRRGSEATRAKVRPIATETGNAYMPLICPNCGQALPLSEAVDPPLSEAVDTPRSTGGAEVKPPPAS